MYRILSWQATLLHFFSLNLQDAVLVDCEGDFDLDLPLRLLLDIWVFTESSFSFQDLLVIAIRQRITQITLKW